MRRRARRGRPAGRSGTRTARPLASAALVVVLLGAVGSAGPALAQDYVGASPGGGGEVRPPTGPGAGGGDGDAPRGPGPDQGGDYVGLAPDPGQTGDYVGLPGPARAGDDRGVDVTGAAARRSPGAAGVGGGASGRDDRRLARTGTDEATVAMQASPVSASDGVVLAGLGLAGLVLVARRARMRK